MRLVGILSWFDESASWLANAVSGYARVCDEIVAVDGSYALYPGGRARSHPDQAEAVMAACETMGVGCTIHRPRESFRGNEVHKRNFCLQLARATLGPAPVDGPPIDSFVIIFDGDYQVMICDDPAYTRSIIAESDKHALTYTLYQGVDLLKDEWMAMQAQQTDISTEWTFRDRGIFRWTDDLAYGPAHYCLRGTYEGEQHWLRGPDLSPGQGDKATDVDHLGRNLVVLHKHDKRAQVRTRAASGYYALRDQAEVEKITPETLYGEPKEFDMSFSSLTLNGYSPLNAAPDTTA